MRVVNLMNKAVDEAMITAGVVELHKNQRKRLLSCLEDDHPSSSRKRLIKLAEFLADFAVLDGEGDDGEVVTHVVINCSPALEPHLVKALDAHCCKAMRWVNNKLENVA